MNITSVDHGELIHGVLLKVAMRECMAPPARVKKDALPVCPMAHPVLTHSALMPGLYGRFMTVFYVQVL